MAKIDSLEPLMIEELRDILDAEKQVTKALPKMARAASSEQLRTAFEDHQRQTSGQIQRLNQVFEELGERPRGKTCEAMKSLIEEGQQMMQEVKPGPTRDALLIAAAQKVEHYEMAAYGTARTFANLLGHHEAARLLEETLDQEKETDARLTDIAESVSNPQAAGREAERVGGSGSSGRGNPRSTASDRVRSFGRSGGSNAASRSRTSRRTKKGR
jgi:ferritin-like metal-binding protein YciE